MKKLAVVLAGVIGIPLVAASCLAQEPPPEEQAQDILRRLAETLGVDADGRPSAADPRWTGVTAWDGRFSVVYRSENGDVTNNQASGEVAFAKLVEPGYWSGSGLADWSVDEEGIDALGFSYGFEGGGRVPLDSSSELVIDFRQGVYDLIILPGGEYGDGMMVEYSTTIREFSDGGRLGLPTLAEPSSSQQPAGVRPGLRIELEELPLPRSGLRLCGGRTLADGARADWDVWPRGFPPSEPCPDITRRKP